MTMSLQALHAAGLCIKVLALDLDDTLLNEGLGISPGNLRALAAAEGRGVQVVLASGRAPEAMAPFARTLGLDRREGHLIAFNGSLIVESDTGRTEWGIQLGTELLGDMWDLAGAFNQPIQTYVPGEILFSIDNPWTLRDAELSGLKRRRVDRDEFLREARVKVLLPGDPVALDPVEARFKDVFRGRANMLRSKPYFFEIMRPEADKGLALERLAAMEGLAREEVMAIGDSWNDEGMLRWAGVSVAMANGAEDIRRIATWVTTRSNDEDGVAEAVQRFILR
jgi:Cof subfamily protein (haloacid dehalogenase superfamily)